MTIGTALAMAGDMLDPIATLRAAADAASSHAAFARSRGVDPSLLSRVLSGERAPTFGFAQAVSDVVPLSAWPRVWATEPAVAVPGGER